MCFETTLATTKICNVLQAKVSGYEINVLISERVAVANELISECQGMR